MVVNEGGPASVQEAYNELHVFHNARRRRRKLEETGTTADYFLGGS